MARCQARQFRIVFLENGVRKALAWSPQQNEKLAGPEQDIQKPPALQVLEVLAVHGDFESALRALFNKASHCRQLQRHLPLVPAARINALKVLVTQLDEMVDAKVLLRQTGRRRTFAEIYRADSGFH
jgi:hypothetical protein